MTGGLVRDVLAAQLPIGETADEELALRQGTEQPGILFGEEIEPLVTMLVFNFGFGLSELGKSQSMEDCNV